jgi:hypothetical protein
MRHAVSHHGDRRHHGQHKNQQQLGAEAHRNTPEILFKPFALISFAFHEEESISRLTAAVKEPAVGWAIS